MDQAIIENIKKMPVNGNRLELPKNEQFANYLALKKVLMQAGAKYVKCGFVFPNGDAEAIKLRLTGGEVINDKKKFQFFATPKELAQLLVEMADVQQGHRCLEPSAGQGAIAELLIKYAGNCEMVELSPDNCKVLIDKDFVPHQRDFLDIDPSLFGLVDRIVANPPFTKNQDIDHVLHMYKFLAPGGRLVSVMSPSWTFGSQKKQEAFKEWLNIHEAEVTELPEGTFKESGTNVRSVIIQIDNPKE